MTFDDVKTGTGKSKDGYTKLEFCGKQAKKDSLEYFWVDTCCINKANLAELDEAIRSMFRWYRNADKCYVYFSDVSTCPHDDDQNPPAWHAAFRNSRWFTRGWTLQELLAPASVKFFSRERRLLGNKTTLEGLVQEVTQIPARALQKAPLSDFSMNERLGWAIGRNTKRIEDKAYCLLGIFNIFIPLMYGEGDNAFKRLKQEIKKQSGEGHDIDVSDHILHEISLPQVLPPQRPVQTFPAQQSFGLASGHSRLSYSRQEGISHVLKILKTSDYEGVKMSSTTRVSGTCEWFVQNLDYQKWRQKTGKSILWYSADPGCGKTVLARYLVDEVYCASPLILYFFFQRHDRRHNALSTALCAILHQLYRQRLHLVQYAEDVYEELGQRFVDEPTSLWRLFQQSIAKSCEGGIICVLDALDECDTEECKTLFKLLLEEPHQPLKGTGFVKFLITSRPYYQIQQLFRDMNTHLPVFYITGETESKSISQDVETFIHIQVSRLDLDLKERLEVERKLLQKQNQDQTFLWAFLLTEQLHAEPPSTHKKMLAAIDQLPPTILEAYDTILRNCPNVKKARKILSVIIAARQPLTLDQMDAILALEKYVRRLEDLDLEGSKRLAQTVRHTCGLFVRVTDSKIYLIHQTAQDFLHCSHAATSSKTPCHQQKLLWQCCIVDTRAHFELASACIRFLRLGDMVRRPSSRSVSTKKLLATPTAKNTGFDFSNLATRRKLAQVESFAAYATANWTFHVVEMLQCMQARHQILSVERLLGLGLDLQMLDADGKSVLHRAVDTHVAKVNMELVQCVLHHGGLVDQADHSNMTCMHYAVLRCNQNLARILQRAGFDINKKIRREANPKILETSASNDLISATQPHSDQHGLTPLHTAAFFGREDILPYIIEQGADVNAQDEYGQTPLHLALSRHLQGPRLEDLWEDDVLMAEHVWEFDDDSTDQILSNARDARMSIVETLCEHSMTDPNLSNRHGQTPLHSVRYSENGAEKLVERLVYKGADRTATDESGKTPIHMASRAGDVESLVILIKNSRDLSLRDKKGRTALHFAAQSGNENAVLFILQKGVPLNLNRMTDSNGRNALHHSLHSGSKRLISPRKADSDPLAPRRCVCSSHRSNGNGSSCLLHDESFLEWQK